MRGDEDALHPSDITVVIAAGLSDQSGSPASPSEIHKDTSGAGLCALSLSSGPQWLWGNVGNIRTRLNTLEDSHLFVPGHPQFLRVCA